MDASFNEDDHQKFDVVVIGAGVSGLTAARTLLKRNKQTSLIVLEAKERIGGRTYGEYIDCGNGKTKKWDLGGQWVGDYQTNVMKLLEELELDTYPQYMKGKKILQLSDNLIRYYSTNIPSMPWYALLDFAYLLHKINKMTKNFPLDDPYSFPNAEKWDNITVAEALDQMSFFPKLMKETLNAAFATLFGADINHISFLYFVYFSATSNGFDRLIGDVKDHAQRLRIVGGAYQIADKLAEYIGKDNIRLNCPVVSIKQENDITTVTCLNGETFECKYVILAIPPQTIAQIQFTPSLNSGRMHVLQKLPLGHLTKFIITYKKPFWRDNGFSGEILTTGGQSIIPNCSRGPNCIVFDATTLENDAALVGFIGGSQHFEYSAKTLEETKIAVTSHLAECFGNEALDYVSYAEKNWTEERYNGGCPVAVCSTGLMSLLNGSLRDKHGSVHFAGTESANVCCGYISGAVQAGERAALEVSELLFPGTVSTAEMEKVSCLQTRLRAKNKSCFTTKLLYFGLIAGGIASLYMLTKRKLL
ncbi:DgyrCDS10909 [Dimorphilus gyrociliatus]|uniref:Amine oxidase n=1 Tax=Dimorphilus gyrociliatus TaxID=2664684 RepID=A0A7I8W1T2_9ANNE|nr:DgyrCDS10909 [Dimorphilus gyrociliatus]